MKETVRVRGLGDLRTATTHHIPASPPRRGTTYLDLFALAMERHRLGQELAGIERRRKRVLDRLAEAEDVMSRLISTAQQQKDATAHFTESGMPENGGNGGQQWQTVPIEY